MENRTSQNDLQTIKIMKSVPRLKIENKMGEKTYNEKIK